MNDDRLTETLAVQVMRWRIAPGRFIKAGRTWIPSWRFAPLTDLGDAFDLLNAAATSYTLCTGVGRTFEAEVCVGERVGRASGEPKARAITIALARALGLEVPASADTPKGRDRQPFKSNVNGI